ncbi:MAG: glycosyltransferase [Anaerolineae bacterium]
MRGQRIAYFADASNIHTRRWVSHFARQGYEAHVFSFRPGEIPGATVHFIDAGPVQAEGGNWHYLLHLPTLRRELRCLQPVLLHAHYLTSYGLLGALSGYRPLFLTAWGSDVLVAPRRSLAYRILLHFTLARADLVTSDAEVMSREIMHYGLPADRLLTVPLGVDRRLFHIEGRDWPACGRQLISTRYLVPNTNLGTVLAALGQARHRVTDLRLDVVGDGPEWPHLEAMARHLEVDGIVRWRGEIEHDHLPALLREADLYVALTLSDSTSVSLLEAMACGVFPIVSDLPANREWIEPGVNGLLVPSHDKQILADAIYHIAYDPTLRRRAALHNLELIAERGDWEKSMNQVEAFYRSCC